MPIFMNGKVLRFARIRHPELRVPEKENPKIFKFQDILDMVDRRIASITQCTPTSDLSVDDDNLETE